jgi:hypothetical protein
LSVHSDRGTSFRRFAWRIVATFAAALLVGCVGGPAAVSPAVSNDALSRPTSATSSQDLLYVGGSNGDATYIFSYPNLQLVGKLKGHSTGLCSDTKGNVYVTTWSANPPRGAILKYSHGSTKPVLTLADGYRPVGCAVDPKTGTLAAANLGTLSGRETNIEVWNHGAGMPTLWGDASFEFFSFCGFDDHGNLFVDGVNAANDVEFAEMPKNGTLQNISLNQRIEAPGSVQWDGTYITVADAKAHELYRFAIAGYAGALEGSTTLTGWQITRTTQTWITGSTVIAPYGQAAKGIGLWNYPNGGNPTSTTGGILRNGWVQSLTVSVAPKVDPIRSR